MSDSAEITASAGEQGEQAAEFEAITSQEDFDKRIQQRIARERSKFADYEDLKSQAASAATFQERIGELEAANGDLTGKVQAFEAATERVGIISEVAKAEGVPPDALRGDTRDEIQAHAMTLKELFKPKAPVISGQERSPGQLSVSPEVQAVRKLFNS